MTFDPTPPVFRDPDRLRAPLERPVLAIGNFDGVHRGHRKLMGVARSLARRLAKPWGVLTFEPHSRAYIRADEQLFPLCSLADKLKLLAREELDGVVILGFNAALAGLSAAAFVESVLVGRLDVSGVAVGEDFRFGQDRVGNAAYLARRGAELGFETAVLPSLVVGGTRMSSSAIRSDIMVGRVEKAAAMLGHYWFVGGPVVSGPGEPPRIAINPACTVAYGLYAVRVAAQGQVRDAVATRSPASEDGAAVLSLTLLDGAEDLGNGTVTVEFVAWIRGDVPFPSEEARAERLSRDRTEAIQALSAARSDETIESVLPSSPRQ
jgi:riboflavin kinase / FMN adenylyltransferase